MHKQLAIEANESNQHHEQKYRQLKQQQYKSSHQQQRFTYCTYDNFPEYLFYAVDPTFLCCVPGMEEMCHFKLLLQYKSA